MAYLSLVRTGFLRNGSISAWCPTRKISSKNSLKLVEVGPRDGLQNEKATIPTSTKVELVNRLSDTGLQYIEVTSFVSPQWVPQLADAREVFSRIQRRSGTVYAALVPNKQGMLSALKVNPSEVAIFTAASESFCKRNINCTVAESIQRFEEVLELAKENHVPVRGYISCVLGCPYEGLVSPDAVARVTEALWKQGCREISLGDTTGVGTPESVDKMLSVLLKRGGICPKDVLAIHCHDTGGRALENISVAVDKYGITTIDASIGGLGGCPFAGPGAPGNVATEAVVKHLMNKGYCFEPALNVNKLTEIGFWIREEIGKAKFSSSSVP